MPVSEAATASDTGMARLQLVRVTEHDLLPEH
jgi:hypothetical protein